MVFSLMAADLYLSTKWHQQVQPWWVPNWTWNCDNGSSSTFHGLYGLVFSDQLQPKLLLTALKMHPVPNLSKSLLSWKFLCTKSENYISSLPINNPTIWFCGPQQSKNYTITSAIATDTSIMSISENFRITVFTYFHFKFKSRFESRFQMLKG